MEFFQFIVDFFNDIRDFVNDLLVFLVGWVIIYWIEIKIASITFAWDIAGAILVNFQVSDIVNNAWSSLSPETQSAFSFFNVPEALTLIFQGFVTRFVIGFLRL